MNDEKSMRGEIAVNEWVNDWRSYGILACNVGKVIWLGGFDVNKIRNHERRHEMLWKCNIVLIS